MRRVASASQQLRRLPHARPAGPVARRAVALAAVWLLSALAYYWTGTSSANPIEFGTQPDDPYNLQATAFLNGHLSLPIRPPAGLLALPNPYDPGQNGSYQQALPIHDLALHDGHFYLTWGPTPPATLFAPWRILHLGQLGQNLACLIYAWIGLAFALALLHFLLRRFDLRPALWKVVLSGFALSFCSVVPYLLRTERVYEVAVAGGYCFAMAGLYLLARGGLGERPRPGWLAAGSLCIGLAAGSRWDLALLGFVVAGLWFWILRRDRVASRVDAFRLLSALVGPYAVIVAVLLTYNVARFGSPLQFGTSYALAGLDPTQVHYYQLGYLRPSMYYYVIAPVRWTLAFPFFALPPPPAYPFSVPSPYYPEVIGGVLFTTPILLIMLALPRSARARIPGELRGVLRALVVMGLILMAVVAFSIPGATMRYEPDFATLLMLPALVAWMTWMPGRRWASRTLNTSGAVFVSYGVLVGLAISMTGEIDSLRKADPGRYLSLERLTSPLPTLITMIEGHPEVVRVIDPHAAYPNDRGDYGTNAPGKTLSVYADREEVDVIAPGDGAYRMTIHFAVPLQRPVSGTITMQVDDGLSVHSIPYKSGIRATTVTLRRGLNQVFLWLTLDGASPVGTLAVSAQDLVVLAASG